MGFVDAILEIVEQFVNSLFSILNELFDALGIDVTLDPINIG